MNFAGHPAARVRAQYALPSGPSSGVLEMLACYGLKKVYVRIESAYACKVT